MKTVISIIAILLLASCIKQLHYIPSESSYFGIDFRKYTNQGFFITPEKYIGDYESVGLVEYVMVPEANYQSVNRIRFDGTIGKERKWVQAKISLSQGIDSLYALAKRMGADAIMNFSTSTTARTYPAIANPTTLTGYEIKGFAIRRKDKGK